MPAIFLTGFPGFLGSELVRRLLARTDADTALVCLTQPRFRQLALERVESFGPEYADRIVLVSGDITAPDLGLGERYDSLQQETREVYHLAAVYDLGVAPDLALRVNVTGTQNVLDFTSGCTELHRFHYVSTCFVAGLYSGTFSEDHLEEDQTFHNHYESSKYLAEVEVQRRMQEGLPTTIYRPAIVVGDSETGATQKYDGLYFVLPWMMRWGRRVPMPVIGDPTQHYANVVPRDFVIDAIDYLSQLERSENTVYQLCEPDPTTVEEGLVAMADATEQALLRIPMSPALLKRALQIPFIRTLVGMPPEIVDYFVHPARFTCDNTVRDLEGSGIYCPRFPSYTPALVRFVRENPSISHLGMA